MKYLKLFETNAQYESFKGSSDFVLPNVSHITDQRQTLYHNLKKEKPIVLTAKYNAVDDGYDGMVCYNYNDGNIKSIKIDGNTVQFDPEVNHNSNFEINTVNTVIDWDEWTASCPDEYLINGKIKSWTIKPKDSSIVLTQEAFDNEDISYGYVYKEDDNKYFSSNYICTEDIFNEDGSHDYWKEWDFDVASNSLSLSDAPIDADVWSYYNCNFMLLKYNYDTDQYEIIDTVNEVEYITGGIPMYYMFEIEGYHEAELTLKENYIGNTAFSCCSGLTSIAIPNSVTSIGDGAFNGCSGLTGELVIPDGVTNIGISAFDGCSKLTGELVIPDGVTSIGYSAFFGCSGLTGELVIPDGVTNIGISAFSGCSKLTGITIPNSVTSIGDSAFGGCSGLTSVHIGSGVTSIGNSAFGSCSGLTSITIPDSVTSIEISAFESCSGLTSITIPDSVTSIGDRAFYGCSGLSSITCYAPTAPSIGSNTFRNIKSNGTLYYPSGSDYSSWLRTDSYYLGYYNWTGQEI